MSDLTAVGREREEGCGSGTRAGAGRVHVRVPGTAALVGQLWVAVALLVAGGTLLTLTKLLPRLAVEPVRGEHESRHRIRLTVNGRPVRDRLG